MKWRMSIMPNDMDSMFKAADGFVSNFGLKLGASAALNMVLHVSRVP